MSQNIYCISSVIEYILIELSQNKPIYWYSVTLAYNGISIIIYLKTPTLECIFSDTCFWSIFSNTRCRARFRAGAFSVGSVSTSNQPRGHGLRQQQGSRKSKIGWELTKNGCHVQSPELSKKPYMCSFQTNYPYYRGFYASFLGF